jgi:hypothetical protein
MVNVCDQGLIWAITYAASTRQKVLYGTEMKRTAKFIAKIADVKSLTNTANGNAMFEITLSEENTVY